MKEEITDTKSLSLKDQDSLQTKSYVKTPKELGITDQQFIDLAESLLLARDLLKGLRSGPLYELNRMKVDYLEKYFGIQQDPSILNPQETNHE